MAIIICDCVKGSVTEYQDKKYGKNMRVGTPKVVKPGNPAQFSCTVCGSLTTKEVK